MARPHRLWRPLCTAALGAVVTASLAGCQRSLFPESAPRTQFERFDSMRAGAAPKDEPDVFGATQPALRARLTPKTVQD